MFALSWLLSDARSMGVMGFVQAIIYRLLWIMTAIVVVIGIKKTVQNKSSAVKWMAMAAGIVLCIIISVLCVRTIVLDIPYLSHPETMYLSDLEFEVDTNYEYGSFTNCVASMRQAKCIASISARNGWRRVRRWCRQAISPYMPGSPICRIPKQ